MENGSAVRFVEEESQGWTILSTTEGEDLSSSIALIKKDICREKTEDSDNDDDHGKKGENHESGEDQKGGENQEVGESQKVGENRILGKDYNVSDIEGGDLMNNKQLPAFDDVVAAATIASAAADDDDEKNNTNFHISPRSSHNKNLSWNFNRTEEGVLEGHMNNKNGGAFWRASLFATLGFLGWVFISNTFNGGSGKDLRCMKLHPCSIKGGGGDHVLNSS